MGVAPGSPVSAGNTNPAFIDANDDDTAVGKYNLENTDVLSGVFVTNIQSNINGLNAFLGRGTNAGYDSVPSWTSNDVGVSGDNVFQRVDKISAKFNETTGHAHTGTPQDGPKLDYLTSLIGPQLSGWAVQGTLLTGVTGDNWDVSTEMAAYIPSTDQFTKGVVSDDPNNNVKLFDTNGDHFLDGSGNQVYGRITNSGGLGGTWTLSFYSNVSGTETPYSFGSSTDIDWYFQQLFDETDRPVYSPLFSVSSDQVAGSIPDATQSVKGKVLLATATPQPVSPSGSVGTGPRVAMEDHAHQGVHSNKSFGGSEIYGDVVFKGTGGTSISQTGSEIDIDSPALSSSTPSPIAATGSAGSATTSSKSDHTHAGVHSIGKLADTALLGDVTLSEGAGITITRSGQDLQISTGGFQRATQTGFTLADNQSSPATIISIPVAGLAGLKFTYGIQRDTNSRHSDFWVSSDGTSVSYVDGPGTELGDCGITLTADISGGNFRLRYTSTSTTFTGTMNLEVLKIPA